MFNASPTRSNHPHLKHPFMFILKFRIQNFLLGDVYHNFVNLTLNCHGRSTHLM